jgi:AcrR family transcriptional regulator
MVAAQTWYCLADIAAEHCWTGEAFVPIEFYFARREDILHFATREEAEAVVRWRRQEHDGHLRVLKVCPTGLIRVRCPDQEPCGLAMAGKEAEALDYDRLSEAVLAILQAVRRQPKRFATEATRRGISVDQLTAAAIAGAVREQVERRGRGGATGSELGNLEEQ